MKMVLKELADVSNAFSPQSVEFMKAGGSYAIDFGKKLQIFAAETLGVAPKTRICSAESGFEPRPRINSR